MAEQVVTPEREQCWICGLCWWQDCTNDADYSIRDAKAKHNGRLVFEGDVELCGGHASYFQRTNHMNIRWEALEQALLMQKLKV